ncbi:Fur family transcriptional regulator [Magnetospirillum sp. UT-4]|uniref:Fur family transcriptional regulator n=1 Tax=Magnetospirillum sp. UT-4 TaxID=2681467 RepID=UPI00137D7471|nr:Fur family transcriptional regulator [Magnetospirillum sp. UT-4]CAA7619703.1 Ferric-uptake regulator [Magnetospirillum sp. UT-4]
MNRDPSGGACAAEQLVEAGVRPTRPRLAIMEAIRTGATRHLTPEAFHRELADGGVHLSLATVYNTLNHFSEVGLLRRVGFGDRSYYCTNAAEHHHFYDEATGRLEDIPGAQPQVVCLPEAPPGMEIDGVEVIVKLRRSRQYPR